MNRAVRHQLRVHWGCDEIEVTDSGLFQDGKFKIEYDYNKPEGYEETDEVITGDEINASLTGMMNQGKKPN